jgi:GGDEF domain-containing protein
MTPISNDPLLFVSFSAGIAYYPGDGETPEALLQVADQRLYQARADGSHQSSANKVNMEH